MAIARLLGLSLEKQFRIQQMTYTGFNLWENKKATSKYRQQNICPSKLPTLLTQKTRDSVNQKTVLPSLSGAEGCKAAQPRFHISLFRQIPGHSQSIKLAGTLGAGKTQRTLIIISTRTALWSPSSLRSERRKFMSLFTDYTAMERGILAHSTKNPLNQ